MKYTGLAQSRFTEGYSCSQSILSAFAPGLELDDNTALKVASAFGGGMAHLDGSCGAVTGALMVIGLAKFRSEIDVRAAKQEVYKVTERFVREFVSRNKHVNCTQLLGYNLSQPDELRQAARERKFSELCPKYLQDAVEILEAILGEPI